MLLDRFNFHRFEWSLGHEIPLSHPIAENEVHLWTIKGSPLREQKSLDLVTPLLQYYLESDSLIERNPQGKPMVYLRDSKQWAPVQFNLSHSKNYFVIGFVKNAHIGVDIEAFGTKKTWPRIAERFYAPKEYADLCRLPQDLREDRFYQLWTLKESFIKCRGETLFTGLPKAHFSFLGDEIRWQSPEGEPQTMSFKHLKDQYYLSVALTEFGSL